MTFKRQFYMSKYLRLETTNKENKKKNAGEYSAIILELIDTAKNNSILNENIMFKNYIVCFCACTTMLKQFVGVLSLFWL